MSMQGLRDGADRFTVAHGNLAEILFSSHTNSCTYCYIAITFIWGAIVTWCGNQTAEYVPIYKWAGSGNACVGILMMIASMFGSFSMLGGSQVTRILLLYMTFLLVACIMMMAFSGASFFFREQVAEFVYEHWEEDVELQWPGSWDDVLGLKYGPGANKNYVADLSNYYMMVNGMLGWVTILLLIANLVHVAGIVHGKRACENFIETMNICLLPLGLLMILSGQYVAESATLASAPITAFALCISGVLLVTLSFVGCFGTAADSRGILRIYTYLTGILALFLVVCGLGTLILAEKAKASIVDQWEEIRLVLPPTFDGKYDKNQFAIYVEGNILLMGYTCVVYGFVIAMLMHAARTLRGKLKVLNTEEQKDESLLKPDKKHPMLKNADMMTSMRHVATGQLSPHALLKKQWTQKYKEGSAKQKKIVKVAGCLCCLVLLIIIAVVTASLIFTTFCDKLTLSSTDAAVPFLERSNIAIVNNYKKGSVTVLKGSFAVVDGVTTLSDDNVMQGQGLLTVTEKARSDGKAEGDKTAECGAMSTNSDGTTTIDGTGGGDLRCTLALARDLESPLGLAMKYTLTPQEPEKLVGLDVSCQDGSMALTLPATSSNKTFAKNPWLSIQTHEMVNVEKYSKGCVDGKTASGGDCTVMGVSVSPCQDGNWRANYADWNCAQNVDDMSVEFYRAEKVSTIVTDPKRQELVGKGECDPVLDDGLAPECFSYELTTPVVRNLQKATAVQALSLFTRAGHITASDLLVLSGGANMYSESGDLKFNQLVVQGGVAQSIVAPVENTMVSMKADLGSVVLKNALFKDCAVEINALVSKVDLSHVAAVASHGYSPIAIHNDKGTVYLNQLLASSVWVTTVDGSIFSGFDDDGNEQSVGIRLGPSGYKLGNLKVATEKGNVKMHKVAVDGHVQIETVSGDVDLALLPPDSSDSRDHAFTGSFYFKTTSPYKIIIRKGVEATDSIHAITKDGVLHTVEGDDLVYRGGEMRGSINCAGEDPTKEEVESCSYLGDIYIEAVRGDITVTIGCNVKNKDAKTCTITKSQGR
jgi:hypothetical protein